MSVDELLAGVPPILAAEDAQRLVARLLAGRVPALVFYRREDLARFLRTVVPDDPCCAPNEADPCSSCEVQS